jgi:hypothetical protein
MLTPHAEKKSGSSAKFVGEGRFYDENTFLRLSNKGQNAGKRRVYRVN